MGIGVKYVNCTIINFFFFQFLQVKSVKPTYNLIGPNNICPEEKLDVHKFQLSNRNSSNNKTDYSSEVLIRTVSSANIVYKVVVLFQVDSKNMEPSQRQRKNLLVWLSARQLQKSISSQELKDRLLINNSLVS